MARGHEGVSPTIFQVGVLHSLQPYFMIAQLSALQPRSGGGIGIDYVVVLMSLIPLVIRFRPHLDWCNSGAKERVIREHDLGVSR
jgi:hypothetical protein